MTDDFEKAARWHAEGALLRRSKKGRLWTLDLSPLGEAFGDARIDELSDCGELRELVLDGTSVGSEGLSRLPEMPRLETLSLQRTRVDDSGLDQLRRFPAIRIVVLTGSRATRAGIAAMRRELIRARIVFEATE